RFAPRTTEIQNDQKQLAGLQKQLADGGNTMSQQAKDELSSEIQTKQRDYQQAAQNAQSDYQNAQADMMNTVGTKMMAVLKSYAVQHGYTAVIDVSLPWPQSTVLYYNPGTEITAEIVKLYDQAHPVAAAPAKPAGQQ
ncbi:MAG TPA: OmpH family outer membrane protein, partial [Terriglobales bacterium]|nr:OmpH family outer membrane protein [Terriglobales bacterium]